MKLVIKSHQQHPFLVRELDNGKCLFNTSPTQQGKPHALCDLYNLLDLGSGIPMMEVGMRMERGLWMCWEARSCWHTEESRRYESEVLSWIKDMSHPMCGRYQPVFLVWVFVFKNDVFLFYVHECFTCNYVCAQYVCSALESQKTDPLYLKLAIPSTYMACSCLVPSGHRTDDSGWSGQWVSY